MSITPEMPAADPLRPAFRPTRTYFDLLLKHPPAARKPLLKAMLMNEPLEHEPGAETLYSDLGYMLLGLLLEESCGQSLDVALERAYQGLGVDGPVFRPLDSPPPWPLERHGPLRAIAGKARDMGRGGG